MLSLGPLAAFMSSVTWALGSNAYARVAATTPASAINFTRAALAFPAFFLTVVLGNPRGWMAFTELTWVHLGWFFLSMVGSYVMGDVFFFRSCVAIGVPAALAIASAFPLWSALAGWLYFGETLTLTQIGAVIVVVSGVTIVILSGAHIERRVHFGRGVCCALVTSLCWALNTVAVARGAQGIDLSAANAVRMAIALVLCPWVGRLLTGHTTFLVSAVALRRYGWIFFAEAYGGSLFFVYGLTHAPLAIAAALSSFAPIIATPLAWVGRREPVSLLKFAGIILVVMGAYYLTV